MRAVHSTRTTQLSMAQHSQHLCYDPLAMQHPLQPTNAPTLRVLCSESAWSLQREPIRFLNSGYSTCVHSTRDEAHVCVCGVSGVVECGYVAETLGACAEVWQCMERVLGQFSPCHVHTSTTHAPPLRPSCEPPNHVSAAACEGGDGGVRNGQNAKLVAAAAAAAGHECVCVHTHEDTCPHDHHATRGSMRVYLLSLRTASALSHWWIHRTRTCQMMVCFSWSLRPTSSWKRLCRLKNPA